jgi:hypothetical protein
MDDDMDIDTAQASEDKENAKQARASKVWRTLRLSSRTKLGSFDKIEDGKNIQALFESLAPADDAGKVGSKLAPPSQPENESNKISESLSSYDQNSTEALSDVNTQPRTEETAS